MGFIYNAIALIAATTGEGRKGVFSIMAWIIGCGLRTRAMNGSTGNNPTAITRSETLS